MFPQERQKKILSMIYENNRVSVKQLCTVLDASEATIRRDLTLLEEQGYIERTHGGAVSRESINLNIEPTFDEKETKNQETKEAIGKKAFELLEENDTIILDSGTTVLELAKCIGNSDMPLTIITNSIPAAQVIAKNQKVNLMIVGGNIRLNTMAIVGNLAIESFKKFNVKKAFVGINGLSMKKGLTTPDFTESQTKQSMVQNASEVNLLIDSTKFGQIALCQVAPVEIVDRIITDQQLRQSTVEEYEQLKIQVIQA